MRQVTKAADISTATGALVTGKAEITAAKRPTQAYIAANGADAAIFGAGGLCLDCSFKPRPCSSSHCNQIYDVLALLAASDTILRRAVLKARFQVATDMMSPASAEKKLGSSNTMNTLMTTDSGTNFITLPACSSYTTVETSGTTEHIAAGMVIPAVPSGFELKMNKTYKITGCGMPSDNALLVWQAEYECTTCSGSNHNCDHDGFSKVPFASEFRAINANNITSESDRSLFTMPAEAAYRVYFDEKSVNSISAAESTCGERRERREVRLGEGDGTSDNLFLQQYFAILKQIRGGYDPTEWYKITGAYQGCSAKCPGLGCDGTGCTNVGFRRRERCSYGDPGYLDWTSDLADVKTFAENCAYDTSCPHATDSNKSWDNSALPQSKTFQTKCCTTDDGCNKYRRR